MQFFKTYMLLIFSFLIYNNQLVNAQEGYPNPPKNNNLLFYIQHNANHNTFVYEANIIHQKIDVKNPVKVYRITYENNGEIEQLTPLQKKYAYRVTYIDSSKNEFVLAAMKKMPFELKFSNQKYYVEIMINQKKIRVDKIFIHNDKNSSGLKTKVDYIMVYGKNASDKSVSEKFVP